MALNKWTALFVSVGGLTAGCIESPDTLIDPLLSGSVVITDVHGLEAPAVDKPGVFRPTRQFMLPGTSNNHDAFIAFALHLITGDPDAVDMRLADATAQTSSTFQRAEPQSFDPESDSTDPSMLSSDIRDRLAVGVGVFWRDTATTLFSEAESRWIVLIPMRLLGTSVNLDVYTLTTSDGSPLAGDGIELAQDFFYLAVIGDSVMWGNGLRERDKAWRDVAAVIQERTGRRVISQMHAISGTKIVPEEDDVVCRVSCHGEVQTANTSITVQVDLIESPESMDLLLMNGCANDVGLEQILDPFIDQQVLTDQLQMFCGEAMSGLLDKVAVTLPNANVVVSSYYPITSPETNLEGLEDFLAGIGVIEGDLDVVNVVGALARNSDIFRNESAAGIAGAVLAVNEGTGAGRFIYADPGFGMTNAVLASDPWLYGVGIPAGASLEALGIQLDVLPEDPLVGFRIRGCLTRDVQVGPLNCVFSSLGHPNPRGAQAYAEAIVDALESRGVLPPAGEP